MMKYLVAVILSFFALVAKAEKISFMYGEWQGVSRTTLAYSGKPFIAAEETKEALHIGIEGVPEFGISQYKDGSSTLNQIYFTPTLRFWIGNGFYIDGGIGISYIDKLSLGTKMLGTKFQFSDHIGLTYIVNNKIEIGYRITHVSNANIKKPNPGIDTQQVFLNYTY